MLRRESVGLQDTGEDAFEAKRDSVEIQPTAPSVPLVIDLFFPFIVHKVRETPRHIIRLELITSLACRRDL
jgi:hypothetical protein